MPVPSSRHNLSKMIAGQMVLRTALLPETIRRAFLEKRERERMSVSTSPLALSLSIRPTVAMTRWVTLDCTPWFSEICRKSYLPDFLMRGNMRVSFQNIL